MEYQTSCRDNTFVEEIRQRPISKKKLATWIELEPEDFCTEDMMRNYQRNRTLIDLTHAPVEIKNVVLVHI